MDLPQLLLNTARSVQSTLTQRGTLRESVAASGPTMADLAADKVATELLTRAGEAVFSEESGFHPDTSRQREVKGPSVTARRSLQVTVAR